MRRVVVTGIGVVSSIGNNANEVTASLREARSGISSAPEYAELGFRCQVHGKPEIEWETMVDRRAAFLRTDEDVFRSACAQLAELDLRGELHKVSVPVLVVVGEQDEATPPPMSEELAAGLPDARLRIIPGCAHVPQLQAPDLFLDAIAEFLPVVMSG